MMLDEPSLGLSPRLTTEVFAQIGELNRERNITILLVEQNTQRALELANWAYVIELGKVVTDGPPAELLADQRLVSAYLGQATRTEHGRELSPGWQFENSRQEQIMKRKWITASIAAGWLAGFTGIAASQEILLGYLPSSGGPFATFSKTNQIAAEMALEEINAAGGVGGKKLKLISFDTAGKPDQAVVGSAQARRGRQGAGDRRPVQLERMPRGVPGRRARRRRHDVDGVVGAEACRALQIRVPQHDRRRLPVRARAARAEGQGLSDGIRPASPMPPTTWCPRPWARSCCRTS